MRTRLSCTRAAGALLVIGLAPAALQASPAMIRFGYAGCQACHLSPQGRGLLTEYGRGIDDTHSARRGVYDTDDSRPRRLFHDVRLMAVGGRQWRVTLHDAQHGVLDARDGLPLLNAGIAGSIVFALWAAALAGSGLES